MASPALRIRSVPDDAAPAADVLRILVVDDLPQICEFFRDLRRRLRGVTLALETETNSHRALDRIAAEDFHLVVSDFRMREVDGIEVLRAAAARNPNGYRVLMTGYNEVPTSLERIREARVDAYIQKPLSAQELLLILQAFLHDDLALIDGYRAHAREIERQASGAP